MKNIIFFTIIAFQLLSNTLAAVGAPLKIIELLNLKGDEIIYDAGSEPGPFCESLNNRMHEGKIVHSKVEGPFSLAVSFKSQLPQQPLIDDLTHSLREGGHGLLLLSPLESEEQATLLMMSQTSKWRDSIGECAPLSIEKVKKRLKRNDCEIEHTEVRRYLKIFEDSESLSDWIIQKIAIPYKINPAHQKDFASDFINCLKKSDDGKWCLFCKELVVYFVKGRNN